MTNSLKKKLISISKKKQTTKDPSHDFQHVLRVTNLAEIIGAKEKADLDIIIPAALFHDTVVYPKNSSKSSNEANESAKEVVKVLRNIKEYPSQKIEKVAVCIQQCSFSKKIKPELLESKILQDADRLEATGAVSIMRTFSSGGQMNIPFYDPKDPFCEKNVVSFRSALDLFYERLLIVEKSMHTKYAKKIAQRRTVFLKNFLQELRIELKESCIIK